MACTINCNELAQVALDLQMKFENCTTLRADDLDCLVSLVIAMGDCITAGTYVQNNIVDKIVLSPAVDLGVQTISDRVNSLPLFTINEDRIFIFSAEETNLSISTDEYVALYIFKPGKGNYGSGSTTVLTDSDFIKIQGGDASDILDVLLSSVKSVGDGESIYKGVDNGDSKHKIATIKSDSLTITTEVDEGLKIETNHNLVLNGTNIELHNNNVVIDSIDLCPVIQSCLLGNPDLICNILSYDCSPSNLPPDVIGDNTINVANRTNYTFTVADFTTGTTPAYNDPEADAMDSIRINTLPVLSAGLLLLNGVSVSPGQVISSSDIASNLLVIVFPDEDIEKTAEFNFSARDVGSMIFSSDTGTINVVFTEVGTVVNPTEVGLGSCSLTPSLWDPVYLINPGGFFGPGIVVYSALVQTTSGLLINTNEYVINTLAPGDDFSNIGYVSEGTPFIATGTTPTTWANSTEVINITDSTPYVGGFDTYQRRVNGDIIPISFTISNIGVVDQLALCDANGGGGGDSFLFSSSIPTSNGGGYAGTVDVASGESDEVLTCSFNLTFEPGSTAYGISFGPEIDVDVLDVIHQSRTGTITLDAIGQLSESYQVSSGGASGMTCVITILSRSSGEPIPSAPYNKTTISV